MSITDNISTLISDVNKKSYIFLYKNTDMSIGTRVRAARTEAGMSQEDLAKKIGVRQPTISQLEKGTSSGTAYIGTIASILGVSALWLESGKGEKYPIKNLSAEELNIIAMYRAATDEGKKYIQFSCNAASKLLLPDTNAK